MTDLPGDIQSDLTAVADGSLTGERRARMLAQIEGSPELAAALEQQEQALALIRSAEVTAPEELHARVREMVSAPRGRRRSWRPTAGLAFGPGLAGAAAALAAAAVVVGVAVERGSSGLTFGEASALALRPATMAAPSESAASTWLPVSVEGVRFPYWGRAWRVSGERIDRLDGQSVTTVFYESRFGTRVGYAIVAGHPPAAGGGRVVVHNGVAYRLLSQNGAPTITWLRAGHACIISGRGVSDATLLRLASWRHTA